MDAPDCGGIRPKRRERWDLTLREAVALQKRMHRRLIVRCGPRRPRNIAGADVAYDEASARCLAAVVIMGVPAMIVVDEATAETQTSFPYVPGLLAFREEPALRAAFAKLHHRPDLIIFDSHGLAHARRFGMASHIGYILDIPSIGCAKSMLVGEHAELGARAGSFAWLIDRGERVGVALRTCGGVRPIYVSPGHRVGLIAAIRLALAAVTKHRVPEPTRLADIVARRMKREHISASTRPMRIER